MRILMSCCADCPFEVGDGFFTKNATNPEKRWPGTKWQQIKDMFILAAGDTYKLDATGGEAAHKLTVPELASHYHHRLHIDSPDGIEMLYGLHAEYHTVGFDVGSDYREGLYEGGFYTSRTGEDKPHNNMPPYIVRYYWERTA